MTQNVVNQQTVNSPVAGPHILKKPCMVS